MSEVITTKVRKETGSTASKQVRNEGGVPAVLYGGEGGNVHLAVPEDDLNGVLRRHGKLVQLQGDVSETALMTQIQWDTYGSKVLHVDLLRVKPDHRMDVEASVVLRGDAPGVKENGEVKQPLPKITLNCPVTALTDSVDVDVSNLQLDQVITVGDLKLPEGVQAQLPAETPLVQCVPAE